MAQIHRNREEGPAYLAEAAFFLFLCMLLTPLAKALPAESWPVEAVGVSDLRARKSYLGVGIVDIDSDRAKELKLKGRRGVEVTLVVAESPAAKAGIAVGDVFLEFNGKKLETKEQLSRMVWETLVGGNAKILLLRNGIEKTVNVTIGARKFPEVEAPRGAWDFEMPEMPAFVIPDVPHPFLSWRSNVLGIESEALSPQLAEYFGVKEGVLIRAVMKDSPADKASLKAGDVITHFGDKAVKNPREITNIIRSEKENTRQKINVGFVRDRRERKTQVQFGNHAADNFQRQQFVDHTP